MYLILPAVALSKILYLVEEKGNKSISFTIQHFLNLDGIELENRFSSEMVNNFISNSMAKMETFPCVLL